MALFGGGRGFGGFGGFGGGNCCDTNCCNPCQVNNDFLYTNLHTDLIGGFNGVDCALDNISSKLCCIDKDVVLTGANTNSKLAEVDYHNQIGFLGVERGLDFVKYEAAKNTSDILQGQCAQTQAILNKMDCIEMQNLRDKLCECKDEMSNWKQSAYLIEQIKPCPVPAYLTCNPQASSPAVGFGYGVPFAGYGAPFGGFPGYGNKFDGGCCGGGCGGCC